MTLPWNEISYSVDTNQVIISAPGPQGIPGPVTSSVLYAVESTYSSSVTSASGMPTRWYGSFYDTSASQTVPAAGSAVPMSINTTLNSNHITVNSSSIIFQNAGTYNIQFSTQFYGTKSGDIYVWFKKNGQTVDWSATKLSVTNQAPAVVAAWNFIDTFNSNEYLQLYWTATDTAIKIISIPAFDGVPNTPSIILTAVQV